MADEVSSGAGSSFQPSGELLLQIRCRCRGRDIDDSSFGCSPSHSPTAVGDAPDRAVAIFADQERAGPGDGDADRAGPDGPVADHEAGQKILVFAGRLAVLQEYPDNFVAGP